MAKVGSYHFRIDEVRYTFSLNYSNKNKFTFTNVPDILVAFIHEHCRHDTKYYDTEIDIVNAYKGYIAEFEKSKRSEEKVILYKFDPQNFHFVNPESNGSRDRYQEWVPEAFRKVNGDLYYGVNADKIYGFDFRYVVAIKRVLVKDATYFEVNSDGTAGAKIAFWGFSVMPYSENAENFFKSFCEKTSEMVKALILVMFQDKDKFHELVNKPNSGETLQLTYK